MRARRIPTLVIAALLAAGLAACGGGGGQGSSSATSSGHKGSAPSATRGAKPGTPTATAKSAEKHFQSPGSQRQRSAALGSSGSSPGGAKSFVEPQADNSIPNFGDESAPADRRRASEALRSYLQAGAKGDWDKACAYLAAATRTQLERFAGASKGKLEGCAAVYKALSGSAPAAARANPLSGPLAALRVKGASAFALFYGPHSQRYVMPMAREGGAWKVTQLAPIAYPLGSQAKTSP